MNQIITGDYLETDITSGSAALIVTSPPYPGQRDCVLSVSEWMTWFTQIAIKMHRELAPTGVLALNVKFKRRPDGQFEARLFLEILGLLRDMQMYLIDVYVWDKLNPPPAGNLRGVPRYDIDSWEPIFLAAKSADYPFAPVCQPYHWKTLHKAGRGRQRTPGVNGDYAGGHNGLSADGARPNNVLRISNSGGPERPRALGQSFPPALAERFIRQHTRPGDLVLDPFSGVGTSLAVAASLGRRWLGVEINPNEAQQARQWLQSIQPIQESLPCLA